MLDDAKTYVFAAENHHSDSCGIPPQVRSRVEAGHYYGYSQNELGEQWVLDIDVAARRGILRGGDVTWENTVEITPAGAPSSPASSLPVGRIRVGPRSIYCSDEISAIGQLRCRPATCRMCTAGAAVLDSGAIAGMILSYVGDSQPSKPTQRNGDSSG